MKSVLTSQMAEEADISEVIETVKQHVKDAKLPDIEVIRILWDMMMDAVQWSGKNQQQTANAALHQASVRHLARSWELSPSPYLEAAGISSRLDQGAMVSLLRFPPAFANLSKLDVAIKDGYVNIEANVIFFNSEEYVEGILKSSKINEETIPEQLTGAFGRATSRLEQLPDPIRDAMATGFKVPLVVA
ncbi:unnamed protein product [Fraxinus pennsylvanica]|uniref:Uncharacterized protein n=1 Tax=Fraxinus pennsylvanica TaxID=56036 RepID=A0AAD2AED2_9LAMI|nr:unnamed protein product [Fraxinus pennsylvanica]